MEFVRQLNSRVTVLNEGKVLADGTLEEVQNNPDVIEAYLGARGDTVLSVINLSFSYGAVQALNGINMTWSRARSPASWAATALARPR